MNRELKEIPLRVQKKKSAVGKYLRTWLGCANFPVLCRKQNLQVIN